MHRKMLILFAKGGKEVCLLKMGELEMWRFVDSLKGWMLFIVIRSNLSMVVPGIPMPVQSQFQGWDRSDINEDTK